MSESNEMDEEVIEQQNGGSADQVGGGQSKPKTKLIVNYLPINMLQEEVLSLFSSIGKVESCSLIRDTVTKQSRCYAFVNYHQPEDAKRAIDTLNGLKLQNKTIKISYARESSAAIKCANLFVSNLPQNMTLQEFEALFSPYGQIISSRILHDKITGLSKGTGFIRFDYRLEAERAVQELNGSTLQGSTKPIVVKFAKYSNIDNKAVPFLSVYLHPEGIGCPIRHIRFSTRNLPLANSMRLGNAMNQSGCCVFVYNLVPETTELILWLLFRLFGVVQRVKVVHDCKTNRCKSYGFVTMTNYVEAVNAIKSLNGCILGNRVLQLRFKTPVVN